MSRPVKPACWLLVGALLAGCAAAAPKPPAAPSTGPRVEVRTEPAPAASGAPPAAGAAPPSVPAPRRIPVVVPEGERR